MNDAETTMLRVLPLRVSGLSLIDPVLTLFGDDWGLTVYWPWDGIVRGRTLSWDEGDVEEWAKAFIGADLLAVREEEGEVCFVFSEGVIRVEPDSEWEPWVLHLPTGIVVGRRVS